MAAGFFTKVKEVANSVTRWLEFSDGSQAPVQASVQIDPSTGLPVQYDQPVEVFQRDCALLGPFTVTVGQTGTAGTFDLKGYNSANIFVTAGAGFILNLQSSPDNTTFVSAVAKKADFGSSGQPPRSAIDSIASYRHNKTHRYIKLGIGTTPTTAVTFYVEASNTIYNDFVYVAGSAQDGNGVLQPGVVGALKDTSGNARSLTGDTSGNLSVTNASVLGTDRSLTVTTTSQTLVSANALRRDLIIQNDSAVDITIYYGASAAVAGAGKKQRVIKAGTSLRLGHGPVYNGEIRIIAASGSVDIFAWEF